MDKINNMDSEYILTKQDQMDYGGNPVGRLRLICRRVTGDIFIQNRLMELLSHNLEGETINKMYYNEFKDELQDKETD